MTSVSILDNCVNTKEQIHRGEEQETNIKTQF